MDGGGLLFLALIPVLFEENFAWISKDSTKFWGNPKIWRIGGTVPLIPLPHMAIGAVIFSSFTKWCSYAVSSEWSTATRQNSHKCSQLKTWFINKRKMFIYTCDTKAWKLNTRNIQKLCTPLNKKFIMKMYFSESTESFPQFKGLCELRTDFWNIIQLLMEYYTTTWHRRLARNKLQYMTCQ